MSNIIDKIKDIKRISIFEIALTAMILALALTSRYFDNFIPHVHPIAVIVLLIGVGILRFFPSILLIGIFIAMKYLLFGYKEISPLMAAMHILQWMSLLVCLLIKFTFIKNNKTYIFWMVPIIIMTMTLFLFLMILGDSEYSPKNITFWERVRLSLIFPGDWMNVVVTTSIAIPIVPLVIIIIYNKHFRNRLEKNIWQ